MFAKRIIISALPVFLFFAATVESASLVRVQKRGPDDRNSLLASGMPLVEEMTDCFLAVGDPVAIATQAQVQGVSSQIIDPEMGGLEYGILGLREGTPIATLASCGEVIWQEEQWVLVRAEKLGQSCAQSPGWHFRLFDSDRLKPMRKLPPWIDDLAEEGQRLVTDPLVQEMVTATTDGFAMSHWQNVVNVATTRYSESQGCADAADMVYDLFDALGLDPQYQDHTSGHAPNVIGTILGQTDPSQVYIVIGHLDDLPMSGNAPGADDNGSGAAMVTALADVMSCYSYAYTVKFIVVTGEEYGLYGSEYYANNTTEDIQAVLNGDMIGWEGNGSPNPEDLDLNMHSGWTALGNLFAQAAADYGTGCAVNTFICDSMSSSDHWPFWENGFPAACGITDNEGFCSQSGNYPYYHTSSDTIANCGPGAEAFFGAAVRAYLATMAHLADPLSRNATAPSALVATPAGDNTVDLAWTAALTAASYEVLHAPGGCSDPGPWTLVGSTAGTTYSDSSVAGTIPYGFLVRGVDAAGICRSADTACAEATTTGPCTEPPEFEGVSSVVNQASTTCKLELGWGPVDRLYCGPSATFSVYRSSTSGFTPGPGTLLASGLSATSYLDDSALSFDQPYYYVVRATDTGNGVQESNLAEASGIPTGPIAIGTFTDDAGDTGTVKLNLESPWSVASGEGVGGSEGYLTGSYGSNLCVGADTGEIRLGANPQLRFYSRYDIEEDWDKGAVQISGNGGGTWELVPVNYPGGGIYTSDACALPSGQYFSGTDNSYSEYTASLATWANQTVVIRWVLSSDSYLNGSGWWIDNIEITDVEVPSSCSPTAGLIFEDGFESADTSSWSATAP